jgi:hypothetical protein
MSGLTRKLGMHALQCSKNHQMLADAFEENGMPEVAALHKNLSPSHAELADCCMANKAAQPEVTKAEAPDSFEHFLKIEA